MMIECVLLRHLVATLVVGLPPLSSLIVKAHLLVARNLVFHARTKHIEEHYHNVKERLFVGEISLAYVPT